MKKILVPVDFSAHSEKAIDYAIRLAKRAKAQVIIIHACDLLGIHTKGLTGLEKAYNQSIIDKAYEKLALIRDSIAQTEKLDVMVRLYEGAVIDTITKATSLHEADLVIMGTLGESGIKERIFGSKTAGVIGKSTVPVLAVPFHYEWTNPKKVLLAINEFDYSNAIDAVAEFCSLFNAALHVAIFTDKDRSGPVSYLIDGKDLAEFESRLQEHYDHIRIRAVHLEGHRFQETMEEYIQEQKIDTMVMITHKRSLTSGLFKRSMTRKMSYHINIPLLALPHDYSPLGSTEKKNRGAKKINQKL